MTTLTTRVRALTDGVEAYDPYVVKVLLLEMLDVVDSLNANNQYLEDSLTAAVTGILPGRYDLNQHLLALRARGYNSYLETTKDVNDKTRSQG